MIDNPALANPALSGYHFESGAFDDLTASHGSPAQLRRARRCPCWLATTGQPDPACTACYPFGFVYDDAQDVLVFGPNRKPMRRYDDIGMYELGDAYFTFQTGVQPTHYSRLVLPLSTITVDDILTKGSQDTIRFAHVLGVERADYSVRVPPTGHPYKVAVLPLAIAGLGTPPPVTPDLAIAGRTVTWLNATIPDRTRYVVRFKAFAEYCVWEPQDRNEGGNQMPWRFLCKRLDYLLHPRGEKQASY